MPKSIALQKPEATSLFVGRPMLFIARLFTPLIWILNGTGTFLLRLIGIHAVEGHGSVHSADELNILFDQSHEGGEITATEREILHRVVRFSDLTAREVMIPRVEMQGLRLEMELGKLTSLLRSQPHTRIPVYGESLDDILGIVHLKDLVRFEAEQTYDPAIGAEHIVNLEPLLREAARVPETISIDKMLLEFKRRRQQMAIVIDEYGGTSGLITMGDLLEQVFGDVHDEFDERTDEIVVLSEEQIRLNGRVLISEINEQYNTGFSEDEADTMAGLVLSSLGRPAAVGDEVEVEGITLRVEAIERLRITQLLMTLPPSKILTDEE
jgi:CBS domain containing-hemolysin-like protein